MAIFHHELFSMLLEEEPNSRRCERRAEGECVSGHGVEVEKWHHLERAPDFFPPSSEPRRVEEIDKGAFKCRGADDPSGVPLFDDAFIWTIAQRTRNCHRNEGRATEG